MARHLTCTVHKGGKQLWGAQLTAATRSFAGVIVGVSVVAHEALVYIQANSAVMQILRKLQIQKIPSQLAKKFH